jgi:hypothetical protein
MSSAMPFDMVPRRERFAGVETFDGQWVLKVFLITASDVPFADEDEVRAACAAILVDISGRLSPEFEYGRFGFLLVHTGRRGTCITVTHFGNWGPTFEVFSSSWYRYGRPFGRFDLLDDVQPACCWFEFPRAFYEVRLACELARDNDLEGVRTQYLDVKA